MSDDLHSLHDKANDALVRLLFQRLQGVRCGAGEVSKAVEVSTGSDVICTDTPGITDESRDSGSSESGGVEA